jgi:UDP-N-acetyl-D-galactosamine dehydrogenase
LSTKLPDVNECNIAIIGLGYVGLPLAIEFTRCKKSYKTKIKTSYKVFAYDIDVDRINELNNSYDKNNELDISFVAKSERIIFTNDPKILEEADVFIVTVPTPIDKNKQPDLTPLVSASEALGNIIKERNKKNNVSPIIIFESTVYPGATEDVCSKIISENSGLILNTDYFLGYSPERINPGDVKRCLTNIVKVTSGSTREAGDWINELYGNIISAGTHLASSIKVAEAAKIIENTQRDINIALMNELSIIFNKLKLSSKEVLEAAGTKWNFTTYKPGLVGGHCIGVDPYYLTHKAIQIGYKPNLILAGRKINDGMPDYVVTEFIKLAVKKKIIRNARKVLVMGITFKPNCNDMRNSKAIEIVKKLIDYGLEVDIYDPLVSSLPKVIMNEAKQIKDLKDEKYLGIIIAVDHSKIKLLELDFLRSICIENSIIFDVNNIFPYELTDLKL